MGTSVYGGEGAPRTSGQDRDAAQVSYEDQAYPRHATQEGIVERQHKRFLEMPVAIVLVVLWVAGLVLLGSCALTLYLLGSLLLQTLG